MITLLPVIVSVTFGRPALSQSDAGAAEPLRGCSVLPILSLSEPTVHRKE
jgi:hypothetical protein